VDAGEGVTKLGPLPPCGQLHVNEPVCGKPCALIVLWAWEGALRYPSVAYLCESHGLECRELLLSGTWSFGKAPAWLKVLGIGALEREVRLGDLG
jgi:hypothetical protein